MSQAMILDRYYILLIIIGYCILMILSRKTKPDHDILYLHFHTFWAYIFSYDFFFMNIQKE